MNRVVVNRRVSRVVHPLSASAPSATTRPRTPRPVALVLAPLLLLLGLLVTAPSASAVDEPCNCTAPGVAKAVNAAQLVVAGEVTAIDDDSVPVRLTVRLTRVHKGTVDTPTLTFDQSPTCPLSTLAMGQQWYFMPSSPAVQGQVPVVSACDGSQPVTEKVTAKVEQQLGPGDPAPRPEAPAPVLEKVEAEGPVRFSRLAAPGGAMVIVGLLGLLVVRRLGRRVD